MQNISAWTFSAGGTALDFSQIETPCYVVDEDKLKSNLQVLKFIQDKTGAKILLAQKAFSAYAVYPLIGEYLAGVTSSSLFEARLGFEEMGREVHIYAPAYRKHEMDDIINYCDHIVFNTPNELKRYKDIIDSLNKKISCGLRINPEYSEIETDIYNPCFAKSRMGSVLDQIDESVFSQIDGLHFHTMCEQGADVLSRTIDVVESKFGKYLRKMKWVNFGGGHHITKSDYDIQLLIKTICHVKDTYGVEVYLEPGEAVALDAGYLVTQVLDVMHNEMDIAIVDTSAECHMPDVIEMPYRPHIIGSGMAGEKSYTYRLGGPTCLAGDIIGDYSFDEPLRTGSRLVLCDMAIYSMVKNNTFNGINLPSIALYNENDGVRIIKRFGYEDFKSRL